MFRWIKEHKFLSVIIVTVISVLVVFGVSFFTYDSYETVDLINSGSAAASGFFTDIRYKITDTVKGIFSYKELQAQIEELQNENQELQLQLRESKLEAAELEDLRELSDVLNYRAPDDSLDIVSGRMTSYDGSSITTMFTVNIGSESGIEVGDIVMNDSGLVGKITETGVNWSRVTCICDDSSKISFRLSSEYNQLGIAEGTSESEMSGYMMDSDFDVKPGDQIITSGLGFYPEGIIVGTIKSAVYNPNTLLKEITVETAVNFGKLDKIYVVR